MRDQIDLRDAVEDLLREQGITLKDVLDLMDEGRDSVMRSLSKTSDLDDDQLSEIESKLSYRQINMLVFVLHALYVNNPSGLYRGMTLTPRREDVMVGQRITFEDIRAVAGALGMDLGET